MYVAALPSSLMVIISGYVERKKVTISAAINLSNKLLRHYLVPGLKQQHEQQQHQHEMFSLELLMRL